MSEPCTGWVCCLYWSQDMLETALIRLHHMQAQASRVAGNHISHLCAMHNSHAMLHLFSRVLQEVCVGQFIPPILTQVLCLQFQSRCAACGPGFGDDLCQ